MPENESTTPLDNQEAIEEIEAEKDEGGESGDLGNVPEEDFEGLTVEQLKAKLKQASNKIGRASRQAAKYRTERNNLKEAQDKAREEAEASERTEIENYKAQIALKDKEAESLKSQYERSLQEIKVRKDLSGKVSDINMAILALNSLGEDEKEEIGLGDEIDIDALTKKFPSLKPTASKPAPSKSGAGTVKSAKSESDMSDSEFFKMKAGNKK